MTSTSPPPDSSCTCFWSEDWDLPSTAHDIPSWSAHTFKAHVSKSILEQLWEGRHHADFEVRCGDKKMKIHRTILRSHSEEAVSGVLDLKAHPYNGNLDNLGDGDDPEIVEEMVYYFYHLKLSPKAQVISPWMCEVVHVEPSLVYLTRIYVLAEKYFIEGLKAKVTAGFRESLDREFEHAELIEACHIIFKKTVEPSGEKGLKTTMAKSLANKLERVKKSEMHDKLFQEIPELAFRVLKEGFKPGLRRLTVVAGVLLTPDRGLEKWIDGRI